MAIAEGAIFRKVYDGVNTGLRTLGGPLSEYCRPTSLLFVLTYRCSAKCVHCDIWKNRGKEETPSEEEWLKVLTDLRAWLGPVSIVFTGGEALLKPFAAQLAAQASRMGFEVEFLTNGYWNDQKKIEELARARPWRVTLSVDGIGGVHNLIRGREDFFERTNKTIGTLIRMREEEKLPYHIRLKTVIMDQNVQHLAEVAEYANRDGMEVFYQPIEQNYMTQEDPHWYEHSPNWPHDTKQAIQAVEELMGMKRRGWNIANTQEQFEAMIHYFEDPAGLRKLTQSHVAHMKKPVCAALMMMQFQSNGDVMICNSRPPVGNIRQKSVREIWEERPAFWESGCCYFTDK